MKRKLCILLAVLLLCSLVPPVTLAAPTVYFSAVNDTLLELSDETMPLWSSGRLYVTYAAAWKSDLGISYSYNKNTKKAIFYQHQSVLVCDLAKDTVTDNDGGSYAGAPLDRGGLVFVPVAALAEFFDLEYSYTKIDQGHLVRIKNDEVVLTDERFIEAATAPMEQRYERYVKALEEQNDPVQTEPTPSVPAVTPERRSTNACLALLLTDAEAANRVLDALGTADALTLLYPGGDGFDDILRRAVGSECSVALTVDGSKGTEAARREIEEKNAALWDAANIMTRFVLLNDAAAGVEDELLGEGWCVLHLSADLTAVNDSGRIASRVLTAAERRGRALVLLGTDGKLQNRMATVLRLLREGNCRSVRLRETHL